MKSQIVAILIAVLFIGIAPLCLAADIQDALESEGFSTAGMTKFVGFDTSVGEAYSSPSAVFIQLNADETWPDVLTIPRLHNPTLKVFFLHDPARAPQVIRPEIQHWEITLDANVRHGSNVLVVMTEGKPRLGSHDCIVKQDRDGSIRLYAHQADTTGEKLRYEPQPHKNTVGYWAVASDTATWRIRIDQPGAFIVRLFQGCGEGHGGSDAVVRIGDQAVDFVVEDTGHFQNFKWRDIGRITIDQPGIHDLVISCTRLAKGAVMDVRAIELVPIREE